jgi:uncharacterized damage-inducible protein DinB
MSTLLSTEVERIESAWRALDQVISSLSEEQLTKLKKDRWAIRDHLAHIALAEQYVVAIFTGQPPHPLFGTDQETLLHSSDDELNEMGYQLTKSLPLSQVIDMRRNSHQRLLDTVAGLTDADLQKPFAPYGEPLGGTWLDTWRGNTYEHYDAHRGWIEAMVTQGKSSA